MAVWTNRLAAEQSPYLQQHAHNPVDWYPWGSEALERARREDRPILLSIGYSACHWCHVMERESFENVAIAELMNQSFINVKVDREERPDLDAIYMNTVQMLTGSGGWPLTVFLTPAGEPFYGGTYFPPEDRYGRPGFPRVLEAIARAYREGRGEVARASKQLLEGLSRLSQFEARPEARSADTVARAAEKLFQACDPEHGGVGRAPKFPNVAVFSLFLRRWRATGRRDLLTAFDLTLTRMARGGLYDQLGGGFHRYSVDERWLVPHFEKMLYDNAQLVPLYLDGFVATNNLLYRRVAIETLEYMMRDMQHADGGFFSSQDADTGGEEGQTYVWRLEEIEASLDPDAAEIFCRYYQVDEAGNFSEPGHSERKSILHVQLSIEELARLFGRSASAVEEILARASATLLERRQRRPQPGRDGKILTSWNALAIRAFVYAANVLGSERYLDAAERCASFLAHHLRDEHGRLLRTWTDGVARYPAYLDDHAFLAAALLDLFAATGRVTFLEEARALAERLVNDFADPHVGGFFFTAADHEVLIDRPKIAFDGSLPSGNAVATEVLLRLANLLGRDSYRDLAERTLSLLGAQMETQPFGTAALIAVLDDSLRAPTEVVVAGRRGAEDARTLVRAAYSVYLPGRLVFRTDPAESQAFVPELLRGKLPRQERAVAYVCRELTCSAPIEDPAALRDQLATPLAGAPS